MSMREAWHQEVRDQKVKHDNSNVPRVDTRGCDWRRHGAMAHWQPAMVPK